MQSWIYMTSANKKPPSQLKRQ